MECQCNEHWMHQTGNEFTTDTGITYRVFICVNCKRYYIKRLNRWFIEVSYNRTTNKWDQVIEGKTIKIFDKCESTIKPLTDEQKQLIFNAYDASMEMRETPEQKLIWTLANAIMCARTWMATGGGEYYSLLEANDFSNSIKS